MLYIFFLLLAGADVKGHDQRVYAFAPEGGTQVVAVEDLLGTGLLSELVQGVSPLILAQIFFFKTHGVPYVCVGLCCKNSAYALAAKTAGQFDVCEGGESACGVEATYIQKCLAGNTQVINFPVQKVRRFAGVQAFAVLREGTSASMPARAIAGGRARLQ